MNLSDNKEIKRLAIFFFYDKDGIVDDYIPFMLNDLKNNISELLIVCNGKLVESGRRKFAELTNNILIRENKGFDVWAYKEGMESYGWEKLAEFDEVILMNFTIMGPLYPFKEMFDVMNRKDVDFWGLTLFHGAPFDPFGIIEYGYLPLHIQSHFIVIRKEMIKRDEFQTYWKNRPMVTSYEEAICWHEAIFTKTFEELGYTWDVYIDTRDILNHSYCPIIFSPMEIIKNKKCPIFKRRSFFHNYEDFINISNGDASVNLFEYIRDNLSYDINMIFDNILRLENQADIKRCLHFNYILPSNVRNNSELIITEKKIALVLHIYFEDLIEYCFKYACAMPETSHIYITTDKDEKKEAINTVFSKGKWSRIEVIVIENKGRDVSALLVGAKDFIMNYDYICFAHDKKTAQLYMSIKGEAFSNKCFENILKNEIFVENVIDTFEKNPRLGLITPPPPNIAEYYPTLGRIDWGCNYTNTERLAKELGINVNFNYEKEPIAPLGTMFWFRPKALKTLFDKNWEYKDFPEEPNGTDGTLLHAIERFYPFVVQHEGYYPGWVMSDNFARIEVTNLYYMLRELNKIAFSIYGPNTHYDLLKEMRNKLFTEYNENNDYKLSFLFNKIIKGIAKKILPAMIYNYLKKIWRKE